MNDLYAKGVNQVVLFNLCQKYFTSQEIVKMTEMSEELFTEKLSVDLNVKNDQMAKKQYFMLKNILPIKDYVDFAFWVLNKA